MQVNNSLDPKAAEYAIKFEETAERKKSEEILSKVYPIENFAK